MNEIVEVEQENKPKYSGRVIIGKGLDFANASYGCPATIFSVPGFEAMFINNIAASNPEDVLESTISAMSNINPVALYLNKDEASGLCGSLATEMGYGFHGVEKIDYFDLDNEETLLAIYYKEGLNDGQLMDNKRIIRNIIDGKAEILTLEFKKDGKYVHAPFDHSLLYKERPFTRDYLQRATEYLMNFFNENDIGSIDELSKVMDKEFFVDENNEGFIKTEMTRSNMNTEAHTIGYIEHHKGVLMDIKINTDLGYSKIMVKSNFDIPEYIPFAESGAGNLRRDKKMNSILVSNIKKELESLKKLL